MIFEFYARVRTCEKTRNLKTALKLFTTSTKLALCRLINVFPTKF